MYKIVIVEDDITIRSELAIVLQNNGYKTYVLTDFENIVLDIKEAEPHLIILDINLPCKDGFKLCMEIRSFSKLPIIFVTSRNTDIDELNSITLGGDDFITKPYNISILLARIASLLKRAYPQDVGNVILEHNYVKLNMATSILEFDNKTIELTKNELQILHYLFTHKGHIAQRADIIEHLWDNQSFVDDNTLSVNITRIRAKLEQIGVVDFIKTKHRQGYII